MKPIPECVPDALALVLDAARQVSDDPFIRGKVLLKAMGALVDGGDLGRDPSELTQRCLEAAYRALGVRDPYEHEKARSNRAMLALEKDFAAYCAAASNRLDAALSLSLAGAMADFDVLGRAEAERAILERLETPPAVNDRVPLLQALGKAERVLVVVDRAGEILLDKLLVKEIAARVHQVTVAVAHRPLLTMATQDDARAVGMPDVATVVDPGAAMFGLTVEKASTAFQTLFAEADVVIAKGETHFATLSSSSRDVFFLMRARCAGAASRLGVKESDGVLVHHRGVPNGRRAPTHPAPLETSAVGRHGS